MNVPSDLKYARSDEWARLEGETVTLGITDYAQHELGEIVYIELPEVGATVAPGVAFGVVESVKAVAELVSPVGGEVVASNAAAVTACSIAALGQAHAPAPIASNPGAATARISATNRFWNSATSTGPATCACWRWRIRFHA